MLIRLWFQSYRALFSPIFTSIDSHETSDFKMQRGTICRAVLLWGSMCYVCKLSLIFVKLMCYCLLSSIQGVLGQWVKHILESFSWMKQSSSNFIKTGLTFCYALKQSWLYFSLSVHSPLKERIVCTTCFHFIFLSI